MQYKFQDVRPCINEIYISFLRMFENLEHFHQLAFIKIYNIYDKYRVFERKVNFMLKEIRRLNINQDLCVMNNALTEFKNDENIEYILLSFIMDLINNDQCQEIHVQSILGGLINIEGFSIIKKRMELQQFKLIDLSELNVAVELKSTSTIILEIIITFIL
ncbi:unnamed protein product [Paramecium pentaurelia]|uniref:Uncharacterized protein n=1 Tax=Paramecium pentaurelia TaxID=43138 RepID=A0A8S1TNG1_9CILI|nr:unnamed protein product [Paramecium pentaurelia]